jgi:hypothetical protein
VSLWFNFLDGWHTFEHAKQVTVSVCERNLAGMKRARVSCGAIWEFQHSRIAG